jgi:hypothetical protein
LDDIYITCNIRLNKREVKKKKKRDFTSLICLYVLMRSTLNFRRGASIGSRYAVIAGIIMYIIDMLIIFHNYKNISFLYNTTYPIKQKTKEINKKIYLIKIIINLPEIHRF